MSKRIVLITHARTMEDDRAADHLRRMGCRLDWRVPCEGEAIGQLDDDVAGTIVYGGKYCITDIPEMPFLLDEIRWLKDCIHAGVPTLGICQGAQMIAHILGAEVGPHPEGLHEFGYYPLAPYPEGRDIFPDAIHMPQAHFHAFTLPPGARALARSEGFAQQAFAWGEHVIGLQFHPEITPKLMNRWQAQDWGRAMHDAPGAQDKATQDRLGALHEPAIDAWFRGLLDRMFGPVA